MNKPVIDKRLQYEVQFERARIRTMNNREVEAKNVILALDKRKLRYVQDRNVVDIDLSNVTNLKYSNTNLGVLGSMIGSALGIAIAVILTDGGSNNKGGDVISFEGYGRALALGVGLPLGLILGKQIGEEYYIKWQDYPLNGNGSVPLSVYNGPPSKTISLGWKIPLKW